ncbi:hypothetical protein [Leeuwenhoekiella aequorea]|uniref:Uncharacterized protein n=1 Tax=Leeuwenhoekiella aequorea TaxID=283736 RepID=A0A4Q0PEJ7_9FLAO|nr:hypothetical protein [Leeuwenhoekiella aequorea]RXG24549.1 hypothetical protein DSM00_339 [Leeuwenhoekiella aequorea]
MNKSQDHYFTIQLFNKDIKELNFWMMQLEQITLEINQLTPIEKRLIKNNSLNYNLLAFRRKNTLFLATLFRQEQRLQKEKDYGSQVYSPDWNHEQDMQRNQFLNHFREFKALQNLVYERLTHIEVS